MTNGPESADAPRRSRRAAGSTADAGHQERESQQRARDREALRAYKALTDSQKRPEESSSNPPTRRQLRIAQQQAQQAAREKSGGEQQEPKPNASVPVPPLPAGAPGTPGTPAAASGKPSEAAAPADAPVDAPASGKSAGAAAPVEASGRRAGAAAASSQTSEPAPQVLSRRERRRRAAEERPAPVIKPVTPAPSRAPSVQVPGPVQVPVQESAQALADPAAAPDAKAPGRQDTKPATEPKTRPASASQSASASEPVSASEPNADVADMSVEQALAAREALKHQARNQVAAMEALQQADPQAVDLELLAQQRALAERAAVLNRRTQNIQRLAQENEQRRSPQADPTTAHNLAMVTPLEFVEVPGLERPVMKPPATSHVPVVTSSNPAVPSKPAKPQAAGAGRKASVRQPAKGHRPSAPRPAAEVRHSKILARADALVNAPLEADQGAKPIGARSAFGLDPLDVMTAGLGRSRRMQAVSLGMVGVGLSALILGIILIVGGLGS